MTNFNFIDKQLGKITSFTFFNKTLNCVSGIFSYGDKDGLVWHGLQPENEESIPQFASGQEAMDSYFEEEYKKGHKSHKSCEW